MRSDGKIREIKSLWCNNRTESWITEPSLQQLHIPKSPKPAKSQYEKKKWIQIASFLSQYAIFM